MHRTERAEHAAIARTRAQQGLALAALIKELTGIQGHGFLPGETTVRTGQHRLYDDDVHRGIT